MEDLNWANIRQQYPIFLEKVYLMTNGGGPMTSDFVDHATEILEKIRDNGRVWELLKDDLEATRALMSHTVNCEVENTCFIQNTSWGMNIMALMLNKNFEILTFADEFPSNVLPWQHQDYTINFVPSAANGFIKYEDIKKALTNKTKILIASHVEFATGFRHDLEKLGEFCKENELIFIVDATQSFGVFPLDFKKYNIDVLLYSVYKWPSAGYGIACMHIEQHLIDKFKPPVIGWRSVNFNGNYNLHDYEIKTNASVFELGHPDFQGVLSLKKAITWHNEIGIGNIEERIIELNNYLINQATLHNIKVISGYPDKHKSGIIKLLTNESKDKVLKENNIVCRVKDKEITIALSLYNHVDDIDKLIKALQ